MTEDDESGFDLSRRKVLGGVLTVGAASAATGAGTFAYFSDTEESTDNTVTAGTLDLTVNDASDIGGASLDIDDVKPGWSKNVSLNLANDGTVGGNLYIQIDASGDLAQYLDLTYDMDGGGSGSVDLSSVPSNWYEVGSVDGGGDIVSGTLGLELPTSVGNGAQGKSATIDVKMKLVQDGGSP